jgi:hypothetical protein
MPSEEPNVNRDQKLKQWMSPLRWTLTGNSNRRRLVDTPGHAFVYYTNAEISRALYMGEDRRWVTLAETNSVRDAMVALFECAEHLGIDWV